MKRLFLFLSILLPAVLSATGPEMIVPLPNEIVTSEGTFCIKGAGVYASPAAGTAVAEMAEEFAAGLSKACGEKVKTLTRERGKDVIAFHLKKDLAPEAYKLCITSEKVTVEASDYNGFLYAVQSLKQMLPAAVYTLQTDTSAPWTLPCCTIKDAPRFRHRGFMIDCCRHFWKVSELKKCIDAFAMYKLNRFHWHLTDDQGWRIEIKKYPRLTQIGAFRSGTQIGYDRQSSDGVRYGGFYTREEIKDVIAYAAKRGITIIPEIELPGHMQAALASYPELGCEGSSPQPYKVWTCWGISKQVLCVGKENTMRFLEDVVSEVADIFPGEYFHIGGDECPKNEWIADPACQAKIKELGFVSDSTCTAEARLHNYVTARIQKVLAAKGKKIIGWDEILEGELAAGTTVMSWRGTKGGIRASSMGYDVIMAPNTYCYFDYAQSKDLDKEPLGITRPRTVNRAIPFEKIYAYEPYDGIEPEYQKHIIGIQANLWTEYISAEDHLEYMIFPRLMALSEVQWCKAGSRDLPRMEKSIRERQIPILKALGYNYRDTFPAWR